MGKQPAPIDALKESMDKVADVVLSSLGDEIAKKAKAESDVSKKAAKKAKQKAKKAETEEIAKNMKSLATTLGSTTLSIAASSTDLPPPPPPPSPPPEVSASEGKLPGSSRGGTEDADMDGGGDQSFEDGLTKYKYWCKGECEQNLPASKLLIAKRLRLVW